MSTEYKMSSNDYYGALNRRFDARMKKLSRISEKTLFPRIHWSTGTNSWRKYGIDKEVFNTSQIMYMPNRVFYERIKLI